MIMTRTEKMNAELDRHFKSNKGNYFVYGNYSKGDNYIKVCTHSFSETKVKPTWVALHLLRTFKDVDYVHYYGWIFSKASLRRAGFKI